MYVAADNHPRASMHTSLNITPASAGDHARDQDRRAKHDGQHGQPKRRGYRQSARGSSCGQADGSTARADPASSTKLPPASNDATNAH
jgi:hypothetical protein